ncbi:MAG: tetratricopeptide repeat-containing sensor histidine kinase, partial [Flavihumibacter sp.]
MTRLYERTVDFAENHADSILINAAFIEQASLEASFEQGAAMTLRLKGLYYDITGDYNQALRYFLECLAVAREKKLPNFQIAALTDLAILYSQIKAPEKALSVYKECLALTEKSGSVTDLISFYGNIGALYNELNQPDTALRYLSIAKSLGDRYGTDSQIELIHNNTGNVYYKKKAYDKALVYFFLNRAIHVKTDDKADLWLDYLNIGDSYLQLNSYDSARKYINPALELSQQLRSKSKEADSYAMLSQLEERLGNYRKAFEYQQLWYQRDTSLFNQESSRTIAELQERFQVAERDRQNQELMDAIQHQKTRNKFLTYLAIAAVMIIVLTSIFLMAYRASNRMLKETNRLIRRHKEKLVELNDEKNALIGVMSHDLGAPLSSIQMWAQLLEADPQMDRTAGLRNIRESANQGENLIRHILEVERITMGQRQLELEEIDVRLFLKAIVTAFLPVAAAKQIELQFHLPHDSLFLTSDRHMLRQIMENLLSNAIKFSPPGRPVLLEVKKNTGTLDISVQDYGPGISIDDQQKLFNRYTKGRAVPTAGESSTGLGLFIVKRLVKELKGEISVVSAEGAGA